MTSGTRTGEWSIQDLARAAGTTSRTLRHYGQLGLLPPSRIGANGYRYYDQDSLLRLQRILLLRELGLGLPVIAEVLAGEQDTAAALRTHLDLSRLRFVDLGGLSLLTRHACDLPGGSVLVLDELPPEVEDVIEMVGWHRLPGLVRGRPREA